MKGIVFNYFKTRLMVPNALTGIRINQNIMFIYHWIVTGKGINLKLGYPKDRCNAYYICSEY